MCEGRPGSRKTRVRATDACSARATVSDDAEAAGTFDEPGGLLVALRWPETQLDLGYDLDLWVYGPDGKLAAKSDMVAYSAAEGAWVQDPKNGTYRIVISGRPEAGGSPYEVF